MRISRLGLMFAALIVAPAFAQSATAASGNGLYVAPTSAAYADLSNAANKMVTDINANFAGAETVVLYDQQTFAVIPYYQSAVDVVKSAIAQICQVEAQARNPKSQALMAIEPGSAASGLAALIAVTLPAYAIQGQAVTSIDNTALIGAFAASAKGAGWNVIMPTYLAPATGGDALTCVTYEASDSMAALWKTAGIEAQKASKLANADKAALKSALDAYQKIRDVYLASDKGVPLLGKLLIFEALGDAMTNPANVAVIDMKLDAVGIDSTTRTVLWWRKTTFSANILAHYSLFAVHGTRNEFSLTLKMPGYVNILTQNVNAKGFASSVQPSGRIN